MVTTNFIVEGVPSASSKTLHLPSIPLSTSVSEFRTLISPRSDGFLTVGPRLLRDGSLLSDYDSCLLNSGPNRHAVVTYHPRQRGGCFIFSFITLCTIIFLAIAGFCTCGLSWLIIPFLLPLLFILPCCLL